LQQAAAPAVAVHDTVATPGNGIEGVVEGRRHRFGRPEWVAALHRHPLPAFADIVAPDTIVVALGDESGWLAWFKFADVVRPGAQRLVATLQTMGLAVSLLSGDRNETVRHLAEAVGIAKYRGDAQPQDKRAQIAVLQRDGAIVAMVGDGINDAPSLAQANVSLSFGSAATLTQWTADVILLGDDLPRIADAIARARRTLRVIRQNLGWAFGYNVLAIPLAATGHLTPFAAALGMSVSSLLVVANALRLLRADAPHVVPAAMAPAPI